MVQTMKKHPETEKPNGAALLLTLGYSIFVAANSFVLREPGLLAPWIHPDSQQMLYVAATGSFGIVLAVIGSSILCGKRPTRNVFATCMATFLLLGLACLITAVLVPSHTNILLYIAMAFLGAQAAFCFIAWATVLISMNASEAWMFIISSAIMSALIFVPCVPLLSVWDIAALPLYSAMSCLAIVLYVVGLHIDKSQCLDRDLSPVDTQTNRNDSLRELMKSEGPAVLSLGSLGFSASVLRMSVENVQPLDMCSMEMVALVYAGAILLLLVFTASMKLNLEKLFLASFPVVMGMMVLLPFSGDEVRIAFLGISTALYTIGLLLLFLIAHNIKSKTSMPAEGLFGIFYGIATLIGLLGCFASIAKIADGGIVNWSTVALFCACFLSLFLLPRGKSQYASTPSESTTVVFEIGSQLNEEIKAEYCLTEKEMEVLELMMQGRNVPAIAEQLYISKNTVRTHCKHIFKKVGVHSRQECIDAVLKHIPKS